MAKNKKVKKDKIKTPTIWKFIWNKPFYIGLGIFVFGIICCAAFGLTYDKINNGWAIWVIGVFLVLIFLAFVPCFIIAVIEAANKRGTSMYGTEPLI
jgi:protein-S-isoprenylcysteine O-methyltransferase Ste14